MLIDGQPARLGAIETHMPELRGGERIRGFVAVGAGDEHQTLTVRRPLRREATAPIPALTREARRFHEFGVREQVTRLACGKIEHQQTRLPILEPAVPVADREAVVDARVPLARLALGSDALIVRLEQRTRIVGAAEGDLAAVRRELGRTSAVGQRRQPLRLAAAQVEQVELVGVVAVALGREDEPRTVRAPGSTALAACGARETTRLAAVGAARRDQPKIRDLRLRIVGRFGDRGDHPLAVRARLRRANPAHEPEVLVRDRAGGGGGGGRRSDHGRRSCRSRRRACDGCCQCEPCNTCPQHRFVHELPLRATAKPESRSMPELGFR